MATPDRQASCASRDFVGDDVGEGEVGLQALVKRNLVDANRLGAAIAHDLLRSPFCFLQSRTRTQRTRPPSPSVVKLLDQLRPLSSEMPRGERAQAPARRSRRGGRYKRRGQSPTRTATTPIAATVAPIENSTENAVARRGISSRWTKARRDAPGTSANSYHGDEHRSKRLRNPLRTASTMT